MKLIKYQLTAAFLFFISFVMVPQAVCQRNVSYQELTMRNQQQSVSFDFFVLPGDTDDTVTFTSAFNLSYNFLPFRKINQPSSEKEFFSTANLSIEVFKSDKSRLQKRDKEVSVEGLEPAGRAFWSDTAYAKNYEQSQSREEFLSGYLKVSLKPGIYSYLLQMKRGEESESRLSRTKTVRLEPYDKMKIGNIILGSDLLENGDLPQLKLSEMGKGVKYGKDFHALIYLPEYDDAANYTLEITSVDIAQKDTTKLNKVYSKKLSSADIKSNIRPSVSAKNGRTYVDLASSNNGFSYALVKIPNSNFPNATYQLSVKKEGASMPAARGTFRSIWVDIPTSLLSLDVATDMLHYIIDKEKLRNISNGTQAEREKKFRDFWKERDPTPDTEYNELMAEYYRRIDYAYKNFTTENNLGYNSDRGEIYIKFGPPKNIERKFPTNGPTTEVWTYQNRQFVFRATTGFGDFQLVSDQSR